VLDNVERRRFLVEPARKGAAPALVRALDIDLDKGAGELLFLPWGGRFARTQAHDQIFPARRLPRVQRDALHDAVALVEYAEDGDALCHRRHSGLIAGGCRCGVVRLRRAGLRLLSAAARSEAKRKQ
jgi:hypothetical protein